MQTETQTATPVTTPVPGFMTVTEAAASQIKELLSEEGKHDSGLRVFVQGGGCSGFQYGLMIEEGGKQRELTRAERDAQIADTQKILQDYCGEKAKAS